MKENTTIQHGSDYKPSQIPEPSLAEKAKTLVYKNRLATLSTLSKRHPDWPFGSLMPYALDHSGRPVFLVSTMAMHTQNVERDSRASLFISRIEAGEDPLNANRATLMGNIYKIGDAEVETARSLYLSSHPNASYWVDFSDFSFYHLEFQDIYFVGGFGSMGWVDVDQYYKAEVDPLADSAKDIITHMNTDHSDSLVTLAKKYLEIEAEKASMVSVDRLGFNIRISSGNKMYGKRIAFTKEVKDTSEVREVLINMIK